jgi:hypothetical protein
VNTLFFFFIHSYLLIIKPFSIHVVLNEKLVVQTQHDGGLQNLEVRGELTLIVNDPNPQRLQIQLDPNYNKAIRFNVSLDRSLFFFCCCCFILNSRFFPKKAYSHLDKALLTKNGVIGLKDASRAFPQGNLALLKWWYQTKDEDALPFVVNCWPSAGAGGKTVVNLDYELTNKELELQDVNISIPIP